MTCNSVVLISINVRDDTNWLQKRSFGGCEHTSIAPESLQVVSQSEKRRFKCIEHNNNKIKGIN